MYSGSTITAFSGRLLGAHQNIDRLARRQLDALLGGNHFPGIKSILQFEGRRGPDAIKRKSPAKDEPWHFMQPFDAKDTQLIELIEDHYQKLISALKKGDDVRASFEAAWLAHAVVDGLTPAHHYPYEEKIVELRCGQSIDERTTVGKKLLMSGTTPTEKLKNNWKMWGPKGVFTTHAAFECGLAMLIAPLDWRSMQPSDERLQHFKAQPLAQWFRGLAQEVARLDLYDAFYASGWTIGLARRAKTQLAPALVQAVALIWYGAASEAGLAKAT